MGIRKLRGSPGRELKLPGAYGVDFEREPYLAFGRWLAEAERPLMDYTLDS